MPKISGKDQFFVLKFAFVNWVMKCSKYNGRLFGADVKITVANLEKLFTSKYICSCKF